jgi:hypothetical protein
MATVRRLDHRSSVRAPTWDWLLSRFSLSSLFIVTAFVAVHLALALVTSDGQVILIGMLTAPAFATWLLHRNAPSRWRRTACIITPLSCVCSAVLLFGLSVYLITSYPRRIPHNGVGLDNPLTSGVFGIQIGFWVGLVMTIAYGAVIFAARFLARRRQASGNVAA